MPHTGRRGTNSHPDTFQGHIVCKADGNRFIELRISQAYIALLGLPEESNDGRTISLARLDNHEVLMFDVPHAGSGDPPLFWMELFDHDAQLAVDSCSCYSIEEASTVFS